MKARDFPLPLESASGYRRTSLRLSVRAPARLKERWTEASATASSASAKDAQPQAESQPGQARDCQPKKLAGHHRGKQRDYEDSRQRRIGP